MRQTDHLPNRHSIRLSGYDYTQDGSYSITICTHDRHHIFGKVEGGDVHLSPAGVIAVEEWEAIPNHYEHVSIDAYSVMPNHLHGIIVIHERRIDSLKRTTPQHFLREFGKPIKHSLSTVVGSYKSGVTKRIRKLGISLEGSPWQSGFYDHVIRDDVDLFFAKQYIILNPIFWEYDVDNPGSKSITLKEFEALVKERSGITNETLYMLLSSRKMGRVRIRQV